jgi:molecular chaperone HtpG
MPANWSKTIPFKVDIAGIIEIMGASLYSRPDTPIRELVQNAHDGIMRRRQGDLQYTGRIDIRQHPDQKAISFTDDGIGLDAEEAEKYLGTLGIGITGLIKKKSPVISDRSADAGMLIGQFGIGLFSAFMLADRMIVETRRVNAPDDAGVKWEAGPGTEINLSGCVRTQPGTTVTLFLKEDYKDFAANAKLLEEAVREYADFLPIPIFLNDQFGEAGTEQPAKARVNVINVAWFDPTPDDEAVEMALEEYFEEAPLDVIPVRIEHPVSIAGALYITPRRVPGFSDEATVAVTVRRMVISRKIQGLLPEWASFLRGVLELNDNAPTASREDLVRDERFLLVRHVLESLLFEHLEQLAETDMPRLQAMITWHRYTLAGAALTVPRLRELLQETYRFPTSLGQLTFEEILAHSVADPLFETDAEHVIWYNTDRRQEHWANTLFAGHDVPCVHTLMSFEESLLTAMASDMNAEGAAIDLRIASPGVPGFAECILGIHEIEPAPAEWQTFFESTGAKVFCAAFQTDQPVMAFLNERRELLRTFEALKKEGTIPMGFQRMIDAHLSSEAPDANEVLLNRNHRLVSRALSKSTSHPLGSVLRLLVLSALNSAGATVDRIAHQQQADDLDWIAEALWGRD